MMTMLLAQPKAAGFGMTLPVLMAMSMFLAFGQLKERNISHDIGPRGFHIIDIEIIERHRLIELFF